MFWPRSIISTLSNLSRSWTGTQYRNKPVFFFFFLVCWKAVLVQWWLQYRLGVQKKLNHSLYTAADLIAVTIRHLQEIYTDFAGVGSKKIETVRLCHVIWSDYAAEQKVFSHPHFFVSCFQGARLCYNIFKLVLSNSSRGFLKVFQNVSLFRLFSVKSLYVAILSDFFPILFVKPFSANHELWVIRA